jgi:hypothetical protein
MVYARAMILTRSMTRLLPGNPATRLLALLISTRKFEATDPRDKIYGLLGVASDAQALGITPNYSSTIQEVYIDVARRLIRYTGSFDVLKFVETLKHDDSLPSWVPDWRSRRMELFGDGTITGKPLYKATRETVPKLTDSPGATRLGLQGVSVDTITMTTSGPIEEGQGTNAIGHGLWWLRAKAAIGSVYKPTNESLAMALGRTRIAGMHDDIQIFGGKPDAPIEVKEDEAGYNYFRPLGVIIQNQTLYRIFFTTRNGFMGLAPFTAQLGDAIFLVPGCDTPLLLRRFKGKEFHFVGQCYVHGIMHGEAFPPDVSLEDIVLV